MQGAFEPACVPGDGGADSQEWIVRIDGTPGPDLLHVIRSASEDGAGFQKVMERLESRKSVVAELGQERTKDAPRRAKINVRLKGSEDRVAKCNYTSDIMYFSPFNFFELLDC
jgi:hypothetical protein